MMKLTGQNILILGAGKIGSTIADMAAELHEATVTLADMQPPPGSDPPQPEAPLGPSFSFETSGGTQHITQSLGTVGAWAAPGLIPPNFHGAIGVGKDSIDGVDITAAFTRSATAATGQSPTQLANGPHLIEAVVPESLSGAKRKLLPWLLRSLPHLPPALARGLKKKIAP